MWSLASSCYVFVGRRAKFEQGVIDLKIRFDHLSIVFYSYSTLRYSATNLGAALITSISLCYSRRVLPAFCLRSNIMCWVSYLRSAPINWGLPSKSSLWPSGSFVSSMTSDLWSSWGNSSGSRLRSLFCWSVRNFFRQVLYRWRIISYI